MEKMMRYSVLLVVLCCWLTVIRGENNEVSDATTTTTVPPPAVGLRMVTKILGGYRISISKASYMALLRKKGLAWYCGASIVDQQFLITAAHCLSNLNASQFVVKVGADDVYQVGGDYEVESLFPHPQFKMTELNSYLYDVAVVKLSKKLEYTSKISPIKMAISSPNEGDLLQALGYGRTETGRFSYYLRTVTLPFVSRTKCAKDLNQSITEQMICAGGEAGKDTCKADSGGPLVYNGELIGVTSWGNGECGEAASPGVYAYLPSMRGFIDDIMKNNA